MGFFTRVIGIKNPLTQMVVFSDRIRGCETVLFSYNGISDQWVKSAVHLDILRLDYLTWTGNLT